MRAADAALAAVVATAAFVIFSLTLLPGIDLGDTGSFQAAVSYQTTSARQAYPLYFGLATPFVQLTGATSPARALNLFSALCGAIAAGLLTWLVATITASRAGGIAAGLLLAFSYTFWTQAVIAEVYTLHLLLVGLVLVALHAWQQHQTLTRLAIVCATYALAFGNHLSTILLLPPIVIFITTAHPRPLTLIRPRLLIGGALIATLGALQYLPQILATWSDVGAPPAWTTTLAEFWFDVTKADWRATMVVGLPADETWNRLAMWLWDARQQFGVVGLALAILGIAGLWRQHRPWAWLAVTAYIVNAAFALTYNVGDTHVFLLPGHFFTALAAGAGVAVLASHVAMPGLKTRPVRLTIQMVVVGVMLGYVVWRGWTTWPIADRHRDHRGDQFVERTFFGLSARDALLVTRMPWDQENALYGAHFLPQAIPWVRLNDVRLHFPDLVRDNLSIGRDVVLTADAAASVVAAYGSHFPVVRDNVPPAPSLAEIAARIPRGSLYALTVLTPLSDYVLDEDDLTETLQGLTGQSRRERGRYEVIAGVAGESPRLHIATDRPVVRDVMVAGDRLRVRFDSWLPFDTFRRGGFGHVLLGGRRILFIERGVSLVWLQRDGSPEVAYAAGVYAPQPRYRIPVATSRLARLRSRLAFPRELRRGWYPIE